MAFAIATLQTDLEEGAIQASPKVFSLGNRAVIPARRIGRLDQLEG